MDLHRTGRALHPLYIWLLKSGVRKWYMPPFLFAGKGQVRFVRESKFQAALIREIKERFPGCVVLKNDPNYIQGFPDLLILYRKHWAALEVKRAPTAPKRPNQEYYIGKLGKMSYASFIDPTNKEEILYEIQRSFKPDRPARLPKREQIPLDQL